MASYNYSGVPAAAQNEDVTVYIDDDTPAATKNKRGAAAENGNVDSLDLPRAPGFAGGRGQMLPYPTKTTAAAVEPAAHFKGENPNSKAVCELPALFLLSVFLAHNGFLFLNKRQQEMLAGFRWQDDERPSRRPGQGRRSVS